MTLSSIFIWKFIYFILDELEDLKILECSNDGRGRLSLKIETYSASPDGYIFFPNEQYLYLGKSIKKVIFENKFKFFPKNHSYKKIIFLEDFEKIFKIMIFSKISQNLCTYLIKMYNFKSFFKKFYF